MFALGSSRYFKQKSIIKKKLHYRVITHYLPFTRLCANPFGHQLGTTVEHAVATESFRNWWRPKPELKDSE